MINFLPEEVIEINKFHADIKKEGKKRIKFTTFIIVIKTKYIFILTKNLKSHLTEADAWITAKI